MCKLLEPYAGQLARTVLRGRRSNLASLLPDQIAIIENHRLQFPEDPKLPVVFPLIFYHGTDSPYPYSLNFLDLFHEPELMSKYFARNINIVDLTQISDETIKQHKIISLLEYTQKHIRDRDFLLLFDEIKYLLNKACNHLTPIDQHLIYLNGFFYLSIF